MNTKKSPRNASPLKSSHHSAAFPLPVYLDFVPGGADYGCKDSTDSQTRNWHLLNHVAPESLVKRSFAADETLHKYAIRYHAHTNAMEKNPKSDTSNDIPRRLPSLSVLAEAVFAPLTGVHSASVRKWADAMVLAYLTDTLDESEDSVFRKSDDDLISDFESTIKSIPHPSPSKNTSPQSPRQNDLVNTLKSMHNVYIQKSRVGGVGVSPAVCLPVRPCGYVFRRGDIAWNCRTCQYDSTCVLCDACFHASDHEGHEVYFHRTSPGGCCDCGDSEAWRIEGCCPLHRPKENTSSEEMDLGKDENNNESSNMALDADSLEAFKASLRGRADGEQCVTEMFPPKFSAALGVVIGAAVQTVVQAVDGASIGADPVQWTRRWADQIRRIHDGCSVDEEYILETSQFCSKTISDATKLPFPLQYHLHLRLHNDDVHTYDEVIDALHTRNRGFRPRPEEKPDSEVDTSQGLVHGSEEATELTQHVDQDGQVVVRKYTTMEGAKAGFERLKLQGLHCSVVSTPQTQLELRAKTLLTWLSDIASSHPAASALVVHALVDITEGDDKFGNTLVWNKSKMIPSWSFSAGYLSSARVSIKEEEEPEEQTSVPGWRRRMNVFPPNLASSFLSREESSHLHKLGFSPPNDFSSPSKGVDLEFYSRVPYTLQSERYRKSPHSLWGVMPSPFAAPKKYSHPVLLRDSSMVGSSYHLVDRLIVLDTDLRKQQEADMLTTHRFTHQIVGLHIISGVGLVDLDDDKDGGSAMKPTAEDWRQLLSISSYRAPISPLLIMLLLDPYPTKQLRGSVHQLFLSLLTDSRLRTRFAASLGGIAYRSLTTLFCAGVGTEADTPLNFTVQIFTAGSIVRALCSLEGTQKLLSSDGKEEIDDSEGARGVFCLPLAHNIARCIHTNLLGACKEVQMVLKNTAAGKKSNDGGIFDHQSRNKLLPALVYQQGEQPLSTLLPTAPDDGFLDCRSTKHKRLPHLLRDLEYVLETPGTAMRLLLPDETENSHNAINFSTVWCRLLRLAQGMDPQKRKKSGGHVEYEQLRWLEAFSLSLHFAGARDKLAESLPNAAPNGDAPTLEMTRGAMGNIFRSLLKEIKWWLYKEGVLETGLPKTVKDTDTDKMEALQRSTLHVSTSLLGVPSIPSEEGGKTPALSCATQTKMTENHLEIIESAIRIEQSQHRLSGSGRGTIMGDWLRVPHSPHAGDCLSFHLPLHRSMARNIRAMCSYIVPENVRDLEPTSWWRLPVLDDDAIVRGNVGDTLDHPLCALLRPTLRSSNCRITWSAGPECNSEEAQRRRSRSRAISSAIASAKVVHSLCDHPLRCLAAAEQISRHLWARNGTSAAGMALNYGTTPLCRSFRDLDLAMVQLSASGFSIGLGARRVFSLLLSRFDLDSFLCDIEKRSGNRSPTNSSKGNIEWVMPRRLQDPEHAQVLMEAFFSTICVLVTELPAPPPSSVADTVGLASNVRRELLHVLAANSLSYSKAMDAASVAVMRRDENSSTLDGEASSFRTIFGSVLKEISQQKSQGSRAPIYELRSGVSDEYDPTFFHLKRSDHQQAMDNIARLRKLKCSPNQKQRTGNCLPLVSSPPAAHPRFMPCRMILHLPAIDASIRRALMFALFGGDWMPPSDLTQDEDAVLLFPSFSSDISTNEGHMMRSAARRKARAEKNEQAPFSEKTVRDSSVSFLEVLQLLTLQVHTLEECAYLHKSHPNLDYENKSLSASLSINSYLGRLVHVPSTLIDIWAFRCHPDGPLQSKGSGLNKASILGLLITLYEHRSDHIVSAKGESGNVDDDHGGARYLGADGLKWLLRFISALVDGARSVSLASQSATEAKPILDGNDSSSSTGKNTYWTIDDHLRSTIRGMLQGLTGLWPSKESAADQNGKDKNSEKSREARKAAQKRIMERMRKQQASFAASMATDEKEGFGSANAIDEEADLCIICRCDDEDGENNGPLGYLGHVQRSRALQLRCHREHLDKKDKVTMAYRVVGDKGCQIRKSESLESAPVACIPIGSIVEAMNPVVSSNYDLQSRRIFVRHHSRRNGNIIEGWASIQSATTGYVILSPLSNLCYTNSRWGATRPFIRQCGHAAHLGCVETHVASIHQKSQTETPYDGRFAADIEDGEFLCPLCKQLCNVVVPAEGHISSKKEVGEVQTSITPKVKPTLFQQLDNLNSAMVTISPKKQATKEVKRAVKQYGNYLEHSMQVFSWDPRQTRTRKVPREWHNSLRNWDFREADDPSTNEDRRDENCISDILRLLRQQHIAWAVAGHTAASSEASHRAIHKSGFEPTTSDPWDDFGTSSRDSHSMVLELRRTLTAASSLQTILCAEMNDKLEKGDCKPASSNKSVVGFLLGNILKGSCWTHSPVGVKIQAEWNVLNALISSFPCHLAKDETLALRHEARATAAQIWAVKGVSAEKVLNRNVRIYEDALPPPPLSIKRAQARENLQGSWGTMHPSCAMEAEIQAFRPAVANGVLYMPLLSWDLTTFAGALFSSLLASDNVRYLDITTSAHLLLVARMIQVLVTLTDLESISDASPSFEAVIDLSKEGRSVAKLSNYCNTLLTPNSKPCSFDDDKCSKLLGHLSNSILPFARALVLILRATTSILRQRYGKFEGPLDDFLESDEAMYIEDGIYFLQNLGCPLPSDIVSSLTDNSIKNWPELVKSWIQALVCLDSYHGSRGDHIALDRSKEQWIPTITKRDQQIGDVQMEREKSVNIDGRQEQSEVEMQISNDHPEEYSHVESMDEDDASDNSDENDISIQFRGFNGIDSALDVDNEDSDDEEMEDVDGDGDFDDLFGLPSLPSQPSQGTMYDVSDESDSSLYSWDDKEEPNAIDDMFAHVSTSAIIPYQPSFLGEKEPGPGPRGSRFDNQTASKLMRDLSHLGLIHNPVSTTQGSGLIRLPRSFVELYSLINKVKGSGRCTSAEDQDDISSGETAVCLVTGAIIRAGTSRRAYRSRNRAPGACTLHSRKIGSGTGIFFLLQKCTVLLVHNKKSSYSASIYVDENGEEDPGLSRGRPLLLKEERYEALAALWRQHGIPGEVAQIRSTSDRVIRDNWY